MAGSKKIIAANWKMNPGTAVEAKKLFSSIKKMARDDRGVSIIICPPFVFLPELKKLQNGRKISLGAQDVFWEKGGSFTGEVSIDQLKSVGADYIIVGHSERRTLGETDDDVEQKLIASLRGGMTTILCIGEQERDNHGQYLTFLHNQLESAFKRIKPKDFTKIIIAYEPIWAIGKTGTDAITPQKLHETILYIRKVIVELYNKKVAFGLPILYGGSVEPSNARALLITGMADGFLVGHASLKAEKLIKIVRIANEIDT